MEYTGAKRLIKESYDRQLRLHDQLQIYPPKRTREPLQAYPIEDGSGVTVYLTGQNLHGNNNLDFFRKKLRAWFSKDALKNSHSALFRPKETLKILGVDEYEACVIKENSPIHPIGHLKINTDCDYEIDETVTSFFTDENCIDLGRYGPFRPKGTFRG